MALRAASVARVARLRPLSLRVLASLSTGIAVLASAPLAHAYVRETTAGGTPVLWSGSCVFVTPDATPPWGWTASAFQSEVQKAVANWRDAAQACSYLQIQLDPPASVEAKLDYQNVIKVRHDAWCRPAEQERAQQCFAATAASITSQFHEPDGGALVDGDIELNDINFTFLDLATTADQPRPGTSPADLEGTLTHELGHLMGLDHTCWTHSSATRPVDHQGNPVPDCSDVPNLPQAQRDAIMNSVMYPYGLGGTRQRTPSADDIAGICAIYARAEDPGQCARVTPPANAGSPQGCSCGDRSSSVDVIGFAAIAAALSLLGRRGRPNRS